MIQDSPISRCRAAASVLDAKLLEILVSGRPRPADLATGAELYNRRATCRIEDGIPVLRWSTRAREGDDRPKHTGLAGRAGSPDSPTA